MGKIALTAAACLAAAACAPTTTGSLGGTTLGATARVSAVPHECGYDQYGRYPSFCPPRAYIRR